MTDLNEIQHVYVMTLLAAPSCLVDTHRDPLPSWQLALNNEIPEEECIETAHFIFILNSTGSGTILVLCTRLSD
eukprot:SAG31_NODE_15196_length_766_cov_0.850075_1_plen_74_part_10